MRAISDEVAALIEGGTAAWLATSDRERRPTATRVMGASFVPGRERLALYIPIEQAGRTFDNLAHGSQLAVFFCRVTDYRSVQIKGTLVGSRPARDDERIHQQRYMQTWTEACVAVGLTRDMMKRLTYWPSTRVEIEITASFEQTPGPRAGVAL